jgi:hypothetical protein
MAPRYTIMRGSKQKHALSQGLAGFAFQPKVPYSRRRPIAWNPDEDGDLYPVFDVEWANAIEDLVQYKKYPWLYNERKYVKRSVSILSFPSV